MHSNKLFSSGVAISVADFEMHGLIAAFIGCSHVIACLLCIQILSTNKQHSSAKIIILSHPHQLVKALSWQDCCAVSFSLSRMTDVQRKWFWKCSETGLLKSARIPRDNAPKKGRVFFTHV